MNKRSCTDCVYSNEEYQVLKCRRYAPKPATGGDETKWPTVRSDDWCGEFVTRVSRRPVPSS